ncbi:MAG: YvcK family protein [Clostridia bacterium]|nr:YvcK family protein [Clostridia bacterium]
MNFRQVIKSVINSIFPGSMRKNVKSVYQRQHLKKGPRLVTIGGGTGLSVLLRGLKEYTSNITAIVSVADDGGSSGRLRGQLGVLPPGDLRDCLVALADTESAMESLFNYRFTGGEELAGHSLGNLLLVAMADLTGSFETALHEAGKVLAIRGKVVPATYTDLRLGAELEDGSLLMGQSSIAQTEKRIKKVFLKPAVCQPTPEALAAIREAEAIILGPGSLYTSVIPNLLIPGMVEEIKKASGLKIYVCNVMTQVGETRNYTASEHLEALYHHTVKGLVDYMIVNNKKVPSATMTKYILEGAKLVEIDREKIATMPVQLIQAPLLQENDYIRHDSFKLATLILNLCSGKKAMGW